MTYYEILGVSRAATVTEIARAYRQRALVVHPDHNKDPRASEQFIELHRAYLTLSDPEQRKYYAGLITNSNRPPTPPTKTQQQGYDEYVRKQREYVAWAKKILVTEKSEEEKDQEYRTNIRQEQMRRENEKKQKKKKKRKNNRSY